ncbi:MAG: polysaccharide biosynthesis tyrosine autokinase [Actinobacteria bacterium]|nr:polysaccharide biosynthesis tyrosine autokinase [Actinomycetota bacterium]
MSRLSFRTLLRIWPWALGGGLMGAVVAYGLSQLVTPLYQSTSVLYYALSFGNTASDLSQGSSYTESQMLSFGELVTSQLVLDRVIERESLPLTSHELANQVSVATPRGTMIMQITVSSASPELAARIANAIADEQRQAVESIAPRKESGDSTVTVRLIEEGVPAAYAYTPNTRLNMLLGGFVGLILVGGIVLLVRLLDQRIKSSEDLERVTQRPFLGAIRDIEQGEGKAMVMLQDPTSLVAEDFRQLQANLRYATMSKQPVVLVVSSAVSGEGKSTIAINLATVLAESGQKVLLIDADLRRPRVAEYAQVEGSVGLTDVLVGQQTLADAVQPLGDSGVTVLTSGPMPPNPGELLGSAAMSGLLARASKEYSTVVVDTAPVLAVADAAMITHKADGLVLVTRNRKTTTTSLEKCVAQLDSAGVNIFGLVLNGARRGRDKNLKYYEYTPSRQPGNRPHATQPAAGTASAVVDAAHEPAGDADPAAATGDATAQVSLFPDDADLLAAPDDLSLDDGADLAADEWDGAGEPGADDPMAEADESAVGSDEPSGEDGAAQDTGERRPRTRRTQVLSKASEG